MIGMAAVAMSYDDFRRQRIEENNRVLESLGLLDFSKSLQLVKKKRKLTCRKSPVDPLDVRRSSRLAGRPTVSYKDQELTPLMRLRDTREKQTLAQHMAAMDQTEEVFKNIKNHVCVKLDLASGENNGNYESRRVRGRPRSIFEPDHLCGVEKTCPDCGSTKNEFQYFSNNSVLQPRYNCLTCTKKFTYY